MTLRIEDAKALGKRLDAKGVVVLVFNDDSTFQGVSYGRTRADCRRLGRWLDVQVDRLEAGKVQPPWEAGR